MSVYCCDYYFRGCQVLVFFENNTHIQSTRIILYNSIVKYVFKLCFFLQIFIQYSKYSYYVWGNLGWVIFSNIYVCIQNSCYAKGAYNLFVLIFFNCTTRAFIAQYYDSDRFFHGWFEFVVLLLKNYWFFNSVQLILHFFCQQVRFLWQIVVNGILNSQYMWCCQWDCRNKSNDLYYTCSAWDVVFLVMFQAKKFQEI
eukprot:TRINITY_DN12291_c2_g1_i1.p2 TRINITY_DN12291_c2_g1~~TRINITY_DN12291_c2_g1_i1.p2  ORF type:complete len:198 (-),score=-10.60 TRINITY_DN12291_c2_g1_i1:23-616(-)